MQQRLSYNTPGEGEKERRELMLKNRQVDSLILQIIRICAANNEIKSADEIMTWIREAEEKNIECLKCAGLGVRETAISPNWHILCDKCHGSGQIESKESEEDG